MKLQFDSWYWSKSLKRAVKFIEVCSASGSDFNKAYVEFETDNHKLSGAYVDQNDLWENWFDAVMSDYK